MTILFCFKCLIVLFVIFKPRRGKGMSITGDVYPSRIRGYSCAPKEHFEK